MSAAFRSHGKGTLVLKGTFAGFYIERASGTNDGKRLQDLRAMCRTLVDAGRVDILEQLGAGTLKLLDCWSHYRGGDWSQIPTAAHALPLAATFKAWRDAVPGERHRKDLALAEKQLLAAARPRATIADLPAAVETVRQHYEATGQGRHFNKLRDAASGLLKRTVKRTHVLYLSVRAIEPLPVVPKYIGNPQGPAAAWAIAQALSPLVGAHWWAMCCTGMMPDEYFPEKWALEDGRLHVRGTKRDARDRFVPLLTAIPEPLLTQEMFQRRLKRAGLGVRPYDGRRSFAHWCDLAGLPEVRRELYLGHNVRANLRTLYGAHESERLVDQDAEALQALLATAIPGGITGGTARGVSDETPMTRAGLEPATYGLKVRSPRGTVTESHGKSRKKPPRPRNEPT